MSHTPDTETGTDPDAETDPKTTGERERYGHHGVLDHHRRVVEGGEDRAVRRRADYLTANTDLDVKHARAVAWAELGWSVPKAMDVAQSTARDYLKRVRAQYGDACTYHTLPEDRRDLHEVTRAGLLDAPADVQAVWREAASEFPEVVPDEVHGMLDAADDAADSEVKA